MNTIKKYPISTVDKQIIELPLNARIIKCGRDHLDMPCLWAEVSTTALTEKRILRTYKTGEPLIDRVEYIGSYRRWTGLSHVFFVSK